MSMNESIKQTPRQRITKQKWSGEEWKAQFAAARDKPWTLAYASCETDSFSTSDITLSGTIPKSLHGTYYKNGPGRYERGGQRYGHKWDGDGLVQSFGFHEGRVTHAGRFVHTEKYVAESSVDRFLVSTFGTYIPGTEGVAENLDATNPANINIIPLAGELLALWEPGSAHRINPHTLETIGRKTWRNDLEGQPFSGHPKFTSDGTLWNFGVNPLSQELLIYEISGAGSLTRFHKIAVPHLTPVHDFAVTDKHLVLVFPPLIFNEERARSGMSFAEACEWLPDMGMRVLTVNKSDWSQKWYALPAGCLFHIANGWEDSAGIIRLSFLGTPHPMALLEGWSVMRGEYQYRGGAKMTLLEIDPRTGVKQTVLPEIEGENRAARFLSARAIVRRSMTCRL